ncbi:SDR family NAD(P)-dependent oxidoreductase, partial [Georgenia sp. 10Sc9-8]|nr:SDR family NAD(P)-dependent oxidoreductase [Georgenia halotolerans]
ELEQAGAQLRRSGAEVQEVRADLATAEGVDRLVDAITSGGRQVDVLVLNAGVANGGPFLESPLEGDLKVVGLNVLAQVRLAKRLLPDMVARGQGRVLMTASTASLMPGPYYATYAASKAFVHSFAEALRHELKDTGVTVTSLLPGPTDTEFFERSGMTDTTVARSSKDDPAKVAADAYAGLMKGEHRVVVGSAKVRAQVATAAVLPDPAKAAVHGAMAKPDTVRKSDGG